MRRMSKNDKCRQRKQLAAPGKREKASRETREVISTSGMHMKPFHRTKHGIDTPEYDSINADRIAQDALIAELSRDWQVDIQF